MKPIVTLFLSVTLIVIMEKAASHPAPEPQFQFGPFLFHPVKKGPRYEKMHTLYFALLEANLPVDWLTNQQIWLTNQGLFYLMNQLNVN